MDTYKSVKESLEKERPKDCICKNEQKGEDQPTGQVASRDGTTVCAEKQMIDGKHTKTKVDGTKNTKVGGEVTSPCRKRKSIFLMGKRKMASKPTIV
ncbi:hypothetical protein M9H77_26595 [Catharanthus roseus]|uniref:Uncharacterized protein n=1 Tax=Catharanthus roseus TaxID=4058 RepID=A0ACC0ABI5_CATRO|nr:hypothetical protein M9H77_26595 [Catharanthus roseus]